MNKFVYQVAIYLISFLLSLCALSGLDFNKFIKKNRVSQTQLLYLLIALALAYLVGSMFMSVIYFFAV